MGASFFKIRIPISWRASKVPEAQPAPLSEGQSPGEEWFYGELQQPLWHGRSLGETQFVSTVKDLFHMRVGCHFA